MVDRKREQMPAHPISIAPMMKYTDRYFRYFLRQITRRSLVYTEMITAAAVLHGNRQQLLAYHPDEHPIAVQLGGSDPRDLALAAAIAQDFGFDEVNLNVGCPSDRVQEGRFGACLMKEPQRVAECVAAMRHRVKIPVTVKTRIGVDEYDRYQDLLGFVQTVATAGCQQFIVHARKAWLKGLSPKENRTLPPLDYPRVYQLKADLPQIRVILNGGLNSIDSLENALQQVDGVMLGRQAYRDPFCLATVDRLFYQDTQPKVTRIEVLERMLPYVASQLQQGLRITAITRHLHGLFHGTQQAKLWRRYLSENAPRAGASLALFEKAIEQLRNFS